MLIQVLIWKCLCFAISKVVLKNIIINWSIQKKSGTKCQASLFEKCICFYWPVILWPDASVISKKPSVCSAFAGGQFLGEQPWGSRGPAVRSPCRSLPAGAPGRAVRAGGQPGGVLGPARHLLPARPRRPRAALRAPRRRLRGQQPPGGGEDAPLRAAGLRRQEGTRAADPAPARRVREGLCHRGAGQEQARYGGCCALLKPALPTLPLCVTWD